MEKMCAHGGGRLNTSVIGNHTLPATSKHQCRTLEERRQIVEETLAKWHSLAFFSPDTRDRGTIYASLKENSAGRPLPR